ncbi:MAG: hypothetical protein H6R17_2707 [Proteobacteria bacterium]|nr:hypothetical protein [Pseudomonadota bacterium]
MAAPADVVDRADSLMRRRRTFVAARPSAPQSASVAQPPVIEDDDLPVLTEVVSADAAGFDEPGERFDETQVSLLASDIAHAIGQQLTCDLPSLLETALLNAGEELRAGITATMETALRDFIARRKQLRLPLDEPGKE